MSNSTLVDLVKIQALSIGAGPITLGSAVSGFRGIEALIDGHIYSYSIQQGGNYEAGTGVFLSSGNLFVRTPQISSNGGAPIVLTAGAAVVFTALAVDYANTISEGVTFEDLAQPGAAAQIGGQVGLTVQQTMDRGMRNLSARSTGPYDYDEFDRPDQLLAGSLTPGNLVYSTQGDGAGTVQIVNGAVVNPGHGNVYVDLPVGAQIKRGTLTFMYTATGEVNPDEYSRPISLILQNGTDLQNLSAHSQWAMDRAVCDTRKGGVWDFAKIQGGFAIEPNVICEAEVRVDGTTITLIDPFGTVYTATDADIDDFVSNTITFQFFDDGSGKTYAYEPTILSRTMGDSVATKRAVGLGGGPAELAAWRGEDFSHRRFGPPNGFLATANTAYRICEQQTFPGGFGNIGLVEISAQQINGNFVHFIASVNSTTVGTPTIEPFGPQRGQGQPIAEIRVSNDGVDKVGLDLVFTGAAASNVRVRWRTIGYFTEIPNPQGGATSLGAEASYIPQNPQANILTVTTALEGLHTLATEGNFAGFGMGTRCWLRATSAIADTLVEITAGGLPGGSLVIGYGLCVNNVAFTVTSATISRLASGSVRLDAYVYALAPTYPVTLTAIFERGTVFTLGDGAYHAAALADGSKSTPAFAATAGNVLTDPSGGATVDAESRTADAALNALLKSAGFAN